MIHDRFYSHWQRPTSVVRTEEKVKAVVKVRIEKDGRISNVSLVKSSGNVVMDDSVLEAAKRVTQIDPLPAAIGDSHYDVPIEFELTQD
jgi:TonB family protein